MSRRVRGVAILRLFALLCLGAGCVDLSRPGSTAAVGLDGPVNNDAQPDKPDAMVPVSEVGSPPDTAAPPDAAAPDDTGGGSDTAGDDALVTPPPPDTAATPDTGGTDVFVMMDAAVPDTAAPMDLPPPPPPNQAPTVATAASLRVASVAFVSLAVLGADDAGEAALAYTWAVKGTAPGAVAFSANGDNTAKNVMVNFTATGHYTFEVVIRDAGGLSVTSSIDVQINAYANDITISPTMIVLAAGGSQQFTAKVFDQFGAQLSGTAVPSWSVNGSCGVVNSAGLFAAGASAASCTVIASINNASDQAAVSVAKPAPTVLSAIADSYTDESNAGKNNGTSTTLLVKSQDGASNTREAYLRFSLAGISSFTQATFRIYGRSDSSTTKDAIYTIKSTSWTETGLSWNNHPSLDVNKGTLSITTTAKYREWDVTALVTQMLALGQPYLNLAIHMEGSTTNSPDSFNSREATSNQPQLVITP